MKLKRSAGVLMHPISLPSDYGIGDLGQTCFDFIDFLSDGKQKLWQILPLNPTSIGNSPYQSFSTFAGNFLLISPEILFKKKYISKQDLDLKNDFNFDARKINYEQVIKYKTKLFKLAFENFCTHENNNKAFKIFCEKNSNWLDDYALFVALKNYFIKERNKNLEIEAKYLKIFPECMSDKEKKDYYYGAVWNTWPRELIERDKKYLNLYKNKLKHEILFHKFLQFEFFSEWHEVKLYANNKNILIIGDLPFYVAFDSADVWMNPELFNLDKKNYFMSEVAGVPPDNLFDNSKKDFKNNSFNSNGQLWGNPVYNWRINKENNYLWWIRRIKKAFELINVLRIDHFRGFESSWSIKFGEKSAANGRWIKGPGRNIFLELKKVLGELPIIAEALGFITPEVINLVKACEFPNMKVLEFALDASDHMPHNFKTSNLVAYTGTHDNNTVVGWYKDLSETHKDKFRRYMNVSGDDPAWNFIRLLYSSVAAYAIVPIQDLMALDSRDRMNLPGTLENNWQFRFTKEMLSNQIKDKLIYLTGLFER